MPIALHQSFILQHKYDFDIFIFVIFLKRPGMANAVQTVCGQAYGAKKHAAMCITLQRAIILHFGAAVILTFLYWFSGDFLKVIGQTESIAVQGQVFARGLIP